MKASYLAVLLPIFAYSCSRVATKPQIEPGRYEKGIKEGDLLRTFILRVPKNYDNKTKLPLVILFHGWTSNATEAETYTQFGVKSEKEGFILAIPNGTAGIGDLKGWNAGFLNLGVPQVDDVKLTSDLLDQIEKDMYVDEDRVYVAGHSNGAMMSYALAAKLSNRIAAIGVVSGTIGVPPLHVAPLSEPVSAIIFHGKVDPTLPYDNTTTGLIVSTPAPESAKWWAEQDGCSKLTEASTDGGKVLVRDYKGGKDNAEVELVTRIKGDHNWPTADDPISPLAATDMIWDFFKAHPKH